MQCAWGSGLGAMEDAAVGGVGGGGCLTTVINRRAAPNLGKWDNLSQHPLYSLPIHISYTTIYTVTFGVHSTFNDTFKVKIFFDLHISRLRINKLAKQDTQVK